MTTEIDKFSPIKQTFCRLFVLRTTFFRSHNRLMVNSQTEITDTLRDGCV